MASPDATSLKHGSYDIQRSRAVLYPHEIHLDVFKALHYLSWALWFLHVLADFFVALTIQRDTADISWQIWLALFSELLLTIPELITACTITMALRTDRAALPRPAYRLQGHVTPSIDIMITSCGEPTEIVFNTVVAAAKQDYPSKRYRIFVLDDGHDASLREAVDVLTLRLEKATGPSIIYLSRAVEASQESHFKSGNLRYGIEKSHLLGEGSEFLAGLDADMIPEPDWLRRMVPHLLVDDKVAIAAGPQVRATETFVFQYCTIALRRQYLFCLAVILF